MDIPTPLDILVIPTCMWPDTDGKKATLAKNSYQLQKEIDYVKQIDQFIGEATGQNAQISLMKQNALAEKELSEQTEFEEESCREKGKIKRKYRSGVSRLDCWSESSKPPKSAKVVDQNITENNEETQSP